jgi:HAD superfamily hydrolase (TIGR01509 family)
MASFQLVIFDNDGVVVDSELLANRVLSDLLTEQGHPTSVEESVQTYLGRTLAGIHTMVKERSGRDLPEDFDETYHQRLFDAYASDLQPVQGIQSVLDDLELPFCLASSGSRERIVRSLAVVGLLDYFTDRLFSAEEVTNGKPAPELFLYAASAMGVPASGCVVVEDSPSGVAAARAAGMTVFGYAGLTPVGRLHDADATFTKMDELLDLLASSPSVQSQ